MDNESWEAVRNSILNKEGTNLIQSFLDAGLDVNALSDHGTSMLKSAAECGNMEVIEFLLKNGAKVHRMSTDFTKPIHTAAWNGHKDIVMFFLNRGVNIDGRDFENNTMLHYACAGGHLDLVKFLLDNGCAINAKDKNGFIPLITAVMHSNDEQFEIIQYLGESGADLECRAGIDGWGVLHFACYWEVSPNIIDYLIKKVPDLNLKDYSYDTPLHYAVRNDNLEITELFLNAGAVFDVSNTYGYTAFSMSIRSLCVERISLFLEKGAYFQPDGYNFMIDAPILKEDVLQNVKLCTQSVVNKFNHADLPKVYEITEFAQFLPAIEKIKIASNSKREYDIAERVNYQIQNQGYCNVLNVCLTDIQSLCIGSLFQYIETQLPER